jgi:hypothetical protein
MKWNLKEIHIEELQEYHKNPRTLSEKEHLDLSNSLESFGLIEKPIANADNTIIGGHQRVRILQSLGVSTVECWVPDRQLTDREVEELNIRLNRNNGSFDYDILANEFDVGDLLTWGFEEDDLGMEKDAKLPKPVKPVISLEFSDNATMVQYIAKCEEIAMSAEAKIKVKG